MKVPLQLADAQSKLERLYRRATPHVSHREATTPTLELITRFFTYPLARRRSPRWQEAIDAYRTALFEAHVIWSLYYSELPARRLGQAHLDRALSISPDTAEQNAFYLLAKARLPTDLLEKQRLLQKATECATRSETVHYRYALTLRSRFLRRNDLSEARAKEVVRAFQRVQQLNPGNIASYAACGYLFWLTGDRERADKEYKRGMDVKAIQRETFVGELSYGRARIAAEGGEFDRAWDLYQQSIDANPSVADCSSSDPTLTHDFYSFMTRSTLARYQRFLEKTRGFYAKHKATRDAAGSRGQPPAGTPSEPTCNGVLGFALNDCASAYFNHFARTGLSTFLDKAIELFEEAADVARNVAVVPFNLSLAYSWSYDVGKQTAALQRAADLAPSWGPWLVALLETYLDDIPSRMRDLAKSVSGLKERNHELVRKIEDRTRAQGFDAKVRRPDSDRPDHVRGYDPYVGDPTAHPDPVPTLGDRLRRLVNKRPLLAGKPEPAKEGETPGVLQAGKAQSTQDLRQDLDVVERELEAHETSLRDLLARKAESSRELKQEWAARKRELAEAKRSLDALTEAKDRFLPLLGRVLANSRFAALFPHLDFDSLDLNALVSAVEHLAREDRLRRFDVAHVDDDFLDLLRLLGRVCRASPYAWTNADTSAAGEVGRALSKKLYDYIVKGFNPDDTEAHRRLLDLYGEPTTDEESEEQGKRNARCGSISAVQGAIQSALADDPRQWWLLKGLAQMYWESEVAVLDMRGEETLRALLTACSPAAPMVLPAGPLRRLEELGISLCPEATVCREDEAHRENGTGGAWLVCDPNTGRSFRLKYREDNQTLSVRFSKPDLVDAIDQALRSSVDVVEDAANAVLTGLWATKCRARDEREQAIQLFGKAAALDPSNSEYVLELGDLHRDGEEYEQACQAYRRAIEWAPREALERLALAEQSAGKAGQRLQQAVANLGALYDLKLPVDKHPEYAQRIRELEEERARLGRFGEPIGEAELVRRIIVELGEDLVKVVDPRQDAGEFIEKRVLALREALEEEFGISVPGLLFRGSYALSGREYVFMIDEVPVAAGAVERDGGSLADALIDRLKALLRLNLARFLDVQEVERLCARWQEEDSHRALLRDLLRDQNDRVGLARILRTLLSEQIPIVDTQTILRTLKEVGLAADTLADAVERLRERMRDRLPGNAADASRIELPASMAGVLAEANASPGAPKRPRLAPQLQQRLISELDALLGAHAAAPDGRGIAIVVDDGRQRVFAQRAFESSFPRLMWLSRGELLADGGSGPNAGATGDAGGAEMTYDVH